MHFAVTISRLRLVYGTVCVTKGVGLRVGIVAYALKATGEALGVLFYCQLRGDSGMLEGLVSGLHCPCRSIGPL